MTVKDRIKTFCKAQKVAVSAFEESIGVSNGYVNAISRSIGIDRLNAIIENYSNLNIEWLLTGRGEMLKSSSGVSIPAADEPLTLTGTSSEILGELLNRITEQAEEIGRLKARIREHEREKGKSASDAQISGIANVG